MTVQRLGPSFGENIFRQPPVNWRPGGDATRAGAVAPIIPSRATQSALATGELQASQAVPTVLNAPMGPLVYWKLVEANRRALEKQSNTAEITPKPWYQGVVSLLFGQQLLDLKEAPVLTPFSRLQFMQNFDPNERSEVEHALRMFERVGILENNGMQLMLTYPGYALRKRL